MLQQEDILWKGVLEEVFEDFIRFLYPEANKVFDFTRGITFLDKELEQLYTDENNRYSPRLADKLAKVYTLDGKEEWILIHVEVQGTFKKDFALRMFTYYYRIFDKYQRRISACAILTEPVLKPRSDTYRQEFMGTKICYQFNVYKIAEQGEAELRASDNLFALAVLIAKSKFLGKNISDSAERDQLLLSFKRELLRELNQRSIPAAKIRVLMAFLKDYVHFENEKNEKIFNNEIQKAKTMDIEEFLKECSRIEGVRVGLQRGIKKGMKMGIRKVEERLTNRLLTSTNYSQEKIAELLNVPLSFVESVHGQMKKVKN
ncbi:RpnC/YadD family protein [Chitinophaga tropicalis]|uniref:Transposase (putative) YhgA-like domain-containing protein n=1 Tax=Chitinophaga tropicalis TaxID=2683588 RepID=A0A7K1U9Z7_9BACT|nr:hypothetical protein [Chitinophaga tropicalis]MVT11194.1 hypothetical protein [Chitinophaga tropicalis]